MENSVHAGDIHALIGRQSRGLHELHRSNTLSAIAALYILLDLLEDASCSVL